MKMKTFILALTVLSSFASHGANKVIYGDDNRRDVYEVTNAKYLEYAQATAGMISHSRIKDLNSYEVAIQSKTLVEQGMCEREAFATQPTAPSCSGFLVGEDLLVTAGHCIKNSFDCSSNAWVFDYKMDYAGQTKISVSKDSVFRCKEILSQALERSSKMDYALIKLDRKVEGRRPLKFRTSGKPRVGDSLVVIGHPSGLPTKIADGASIRNVNDVFFVANLDTYGGNSGSAVLNIDTGLVEGILVRGDKDYIYDEKDQCNVSNTHSLNGGRGEDVTLITNVKKLRSHSMDKVQELLIHWHMMLRQLLTK